MGAVVRAVVLLAVEPPEEPAWHRDLIPRLPEVVQRPAAQPHPRQQQPVVDEEPAVAVAAAAMPAVHPQPLLNLHACCS